MNKYGLVSTAVIAVVVAFNNQAKAQLVIAGMENLPGCEIGAPLSSRINPASMTELNGEFYYTDGCTNGNLKRLNGNISTVNTGFVVGALGSDPLGSAHLVVADIDNNAIKTIDANGTTLATYDLGARGFSAALVHDVTTGPGAPNDIYFSYSPAGHIYTAQMGSSAPPQLFAPVPVQAQALQIVGNTLYFVHGGTGDIMKLDVPAGGFPSVAFDAPGGARVFSGALSSNGNNLTAFVELDTAPVTYDLIEITDLSTGAFDVVAAGIPASDLAGKHGVDAFQIVDYGTAPLPVELISFDANNGDEDGTVVLTWTTASEINNSHFEVEHSTDGLNFEVLGRVDGQGTTQTKTDYSYIHKTPGEGNNYYRLRQVDRNNQFKYSAVKVATLDGATLKAFPTLARPDGEVRVTIGGEDADRGLALIFNREGRLVGEQHLDHTNGKLKAPSDAGIYFVHIHKAGAGSGKPTQNDSFKIVVQQHQP